MLEVIARFAQRRKGWRWWCQLCDAWADVAEGCDEINDYHEHYEEKHPDEERK